MLARWPEEVRRVGACGGHCRGHHRDLGVRVRRTWCRVLCVVWCTYGVCSPGSASASASASVSASG